jgi:heptose I phosphotransferase
MLSRMEAAGLPVPAWIAYGRTSAGEAFLMVDGVSGASLNELLADHRMTPGQIAFVAGRLGATVAGFHEAGFATPDLSAKHLRIRIPAMTMTVLDWQSAPSPGFVSWRDRLNSVALLNATVPESLAGPRTRLRFLREYLGSCEQPRPSLREAVMFIAERHGQLARRSSVVAQQTVHQPDQRLVWLDGERAVAIPAVGRTGPDAWHRADDRQRTTWTTFDPVGRIIAGIRGRPWRSPAADAARLLFQLERSCVPAPRLQAYGQTLRSWGRSQSFLLTDQTQHRRPVDQCLLPDRWDTATLRHFGVLLRDLHDAGARLKKNTAGLPLLETEDGRFLFDAPQAVTRVRSLHAAQRVRDLRAWLNAIQPMLSRTDRLRVLMAYLDLSGRISRSLRARVASLVRDPGPMTTSYAPTRLGSPHTLLGRLRFGKRVIRSTPEWDRALGEGWVDRIMTEDVTDRYHAKQGRSIAKWELPGGLTVYLKRHFVLPRKDGLKAVWNPNRAGSPGLQEANNLLWASSIGLYVPRIAATGEFLGPWGRVQSFLAVEELTGMLALHEAIPLAQQRLSAEDFARWKRGLVAEVARMSRELHRRRVFHKDLYLCHFFVRESDLSRVPATWEQQVAMIDFHRLGKHRWFWSKWQAKDLAQLLYSTFDVPGVTPRDRVRFWKAYCGGDWGRVTPPPRIVRFTAIVKAGRYHTHNLKLAAAEGGRR